MTGQITRKNDKKGAKQEENMFLRRQEKRRVSPICVIIVGGLAAVGAISLVGSCRDMLCEKGRAIASMFKRNDSKKCGCQEIDQI